MLAWGGLRSALCRCLSGAVVTGRAVASTDTGVTSSTRRCASLHLSAGRLEANSSPRFLQGYEAVKQLQRANPQVQQVFSLDLGSQREHTKAVIADTISQVQTRQGDTGSTTVQIAVLTVRIKHLTEHMKKNRKDYSTLRALVQLVHRRRKLLLYLKRTNLQDYEKTITELNLKHPVTEKYPKKSVSHQNRIALKQKNKKK